MKLDLSSPAFDSGSRLPDRFTCAGENVSPPLAWSNLPEGVQSLALLVDDPDASQAGQGPFAHWVLYNLPAGLFSLPENSTGGQNGPGSEGRNSFGRQGYEGPCPPVGETHTYYFRLFALDARLEIAAGATRAQVINAMKGHILEQAEMLASFGR